MNTDSPLSFYNQGNSYFQRGLWDLAIANFTSAINIDPNYAEAWNRPGESEFMRGQYNDAIVAYDRAIQIDANRAEYWLHRGWAYHHRGLYAPKLIYDTATQKDIIDQNDMVACHNKGISDITNAINIDPTYHNAWHYLGWLFLNIGNYHRAIEDSTQALNIDSNSPGTWNNRGIAFRRLNKWNEALRDFEQALSIDPNFQVALANKRATVSARRWRRIRMAVGIGIGLVAVVVLVATTIAG